MTRSAVSTKEWNKSLRKESAVGESGWGAGKPFCFFLLLFFIYVFGAGSFGFVSASCLCEAPGRFLESMSQALE